VAATTLIKKRKPAGSHFADLLSTEAAPGNGGVYRQNRVPFSSESFLLDVFSGAAETHHVSDIKKGVCDGF